MWLSSYLSMWYQIFSLFISVHFSVFPPVCVFFYSFTFFLWDAKFPSHKLITKGHKTFQITYLTPDFIVFHALRTTLLLPPLSILHTQKNSYFLKSHIVSYAILKLLLANAHNITFSHPVLFLRSDSEILISTSKGVLQVFHKLPLTSSYISITFFFFCPSFYLHFLHCFLFHFSFTFIHWDQTNHR